MTGEEAVRETDDSTLGGYFARHDRPPAFEGTDGQAYSVAIYVDDAPGERGLYGASLLYIRWSSGGDAPAGHVESGCLAHGTTPAEADEAIRRLTLHEVKEQLDLAIARRQEHPDW